MTGEPGPLGEEMLKASSMQSPIAPPSPAAMVVAVDRVIPVSGPAI